MRRNPTIKTIRKKDRRGRNRTVGYEVIIPNLTDFDSSRKTYGRRFAPAEKSIAEQYEKQEWKVMLQCCEAHKQYFPWAERQEQEKQKAITFSQYAQQWIDGYRNSITGQPLRSDSMRSKKVKVDHLIDFFKQEKDDKPLRDVNAQDCRDCSDWLAQYGIYAQSSSMIVLKTMLRQASKPVDGIRAALIDHTPCENVPIPRPPKKSKQSQIPEATQAELTKIVSAMPPAHRIAVWLGAALGLRISEACALQVKDFDFKATDRQGNPTPYVHIRHALQRGKGDVGTLMLAPTKNQASAATLDLSPRLAQMCREHISQYTDGQPESMFLRAKKSAILSPNTLRGEFDIARKKAGRPDLHFHTLRKTHDNEFVGHTRSEAEALQGTRRDDPTVLREHYEQARERNVRQAQYETQEALLPKIRNAKTIRAEMEELEAEKFKLEAQIQADKDALSKIQKPTGTNKSLSHSKAQFE